jgi:hypothetical protein
VGGGGYDGSGCVGGGCGSSDSPPDEWLDEMIKYYSWSERGEEAVRTGGLLVVGGAAVVWSIPVLTGIGMMLPIGEYAGGGSGRLPGRQYGPLGRNYQNCAAYLAACLAHGKVRPGYAPWSNQCANCYWRCKNNPGKGLVEILSSPDCQFWNW